MASSPLPRIRRSRRSRVANFATSARRPAVAATGFDSPGFPQWPADQLNSLVGRAIAARMRHVRVRVPAPVRCVCGRACLSVRAHIRPRLPARLSQPNFFAACDKFSTEVSLRNSRSESHFAFCKFAKCPTAICGRFLRNFANCVLRSFVYYRAREPANCDFRGAGSRELPRRFETRKCFCRGDVAAAAAGPEPHGAEPQCQARSYALWSGVRSFLIRRPQHVVRPHACRHELRATTPISGRHTAGD